MTIGCPKRQNIYMPKYPAPDWSDLLRQMKDSGMTRGTFYMDRTIREALRKQLANRTSNSTLQVEMVGGVRTHMFQGKPVRVTQAMAVDEATVS